MAAIPAGTVATYGEVAVEAGFPLGASRSVGHVLQQVDGLPWWRVVTASGRLAPTLEGRQRRLLVHEGVAVSGGRVVMGVRGRPAPPRPAAATPPGPRDRSPGRRG